MAIYKFDYCYNLWTLSICLNKGLADKHSHSIRSVGLENVLGCVLPTWQHVMTDVIAPHVLWTTDIHSHHELRPVIGPLLNQCLHNAARISRRLISAHKCSKQSLSNFFSITDPSTLLCLQHRPSQYSLRCDLNFGRLLERWNYLGPFNFGAFACWKRLLLAEKNSIVLLISLLQ